MDFPYFEPIVEVLRLEELKFNSYPQKPQLHRKLWHKPKYIKPISQNTQVKSKNGETNHDKNQQRFLEQKSVFFPSTKSSRYRTPTFYACHKIYSEEHKIKQGRKAEVTSNNPHLQSFQSLIQDKVGATKTNQLCLNSKKL